METATPFKATEKLRDTLLWMVYLDEWELYRPYFPVQQVAKAAAQYPRFSRLLEWVRRHGATVAN